MELSERQISGSRDVLETGLQTILYSAKSRLAFAKSIWNTPLALEDFEPPRFEEFFRYYQEQCTTALCDIDDNTKSHRQIAQIANKLAEPNRDVTTLHSFDNSSLERDDNERYWISFAARVMTMVDVGGLRHGIRVGQIHRDWISGSLKAFMSKTFPISRELTEDVKLEKLFTARNLQRFASIQVIWTNNLADHLQLEDDDTTIKLFSHVSFLELHRNCDIFPIGFVDETIRTLALLLPANDKKTVAWFQKETSRCSIDKTAISCSLLAAKDRQIRNFNFWHDRLVMLKQAFDEADPKTVRQWWLDRRKPVQWFNFWFAIALVMALTIFFGVIQSIEGGLQVWKAYHP